jgi:flagellar basal body-associated protein FliL
MNEDFYDKLQRKQGNNWKKEFRIIILMSIGGIILLVLAMIAIINFAPRISKQPYCRDGEVVINFYCVTARPADWK